MQIASKIKCINNAGAKIKFKVKWEAGSSGWSVYYFNPDSETFDLHNFNIPEGTQVWIEVDAMWGKTKSSHDHIIYSASSTNTSAYSVTGGSLTFSITLL